LTPYKYVTDVGDLPAIIAAIGRAKIVCLDVETTGFSPFDCRIRLVQLNIDGVVYVIDLFAVGRAEGLFEALKGPAIKVGQNLKFEQKFILHHYGVELHPLFDTYRASALIYNGRLGWKHDLFSIYRRELKMEPKVEDMAASGWGGDLTKEQLDYAADDVIHLPELRDILRAKLIKLGLATVAKIEFDAILPESAMELNGFPINKEAWLSLAVDNAHKANAFKNQLLAVLPHPQGQLALPGMVPNINLQSPKQLLASLHRMGLDVPNTNEGTLAMVAHEYPVVEKLLSYREYAQCGKAFGAKYMKNVNALTGRIHTSFYPFTGCGRYASSKPNLQQIPRKKVFRNCFQAPPGFVFVIADYSAVELRIAAETAGDETMIGVFERGEDPHAQTAALVSDMPIASVTKDQRQMAKAVNFGLIYGMGAKKLPTYAMKGYGVRMSLDEATSIHRSYFKAYAGLKRWHREIFSDRARALGVTRTMGGRLRYLDQSLFNEFSNTPVQGTGADGLKRALRLVYDLTKSYCKMVHCVHDEIVLEVKNDPELVARAKRDLEYGMVEGMRMFLKRVPVIVEVGSGPSWAEK